MGSQKSAERFIGICNGLYLDMHPDYRNAYGGEMKDKPFVIDGAYGSHAVHFVMPDSTGHEDLSGYMTWNELSAFAKGMADGIMYGCGRK